MSRVRPTRTVIEWVFDFRPWRSNAFRRPRKRSTHPLGNRLDVWLRFRIAAYRHQPRVYRGPVHAIGSRPRTDDVRAGTWQPYLAGDVQVFEVAGTHRGVFDPSNAQSAARLRQCLERARDWLADHPSAPRLTRWEAMWSRDDFAPAWRGRGISPEIEAAVADRWFVPGSAVLDVGCGEGEVAGWLAERGFRAMGVDIAPAAIARARARFPEQAGRLEYHALDVCRTPPGDWGYRVLIDRGCFHQLPVPMLGGYRDNLIRVSAPDARLLLFVRAFRGGRPFGDPEERSEAVRHVEDSLGSAFLIQRVAETYLDPFGGGDPERALPGLVFWMTRRAPAPQSAAG
jgi:SAM-dependent methyltransferase